MAEEEPDFGVHEGASDDGLGDVGQLLVAAAGVGPQPYERLVHPDAGLLGDSALGLLDGDAAVQSTPHLRGQLVSVTRRLVLEERDGGGMGESLGPS